MKPSPGSTPGRIMRLLRFSGIPYSGINILFTGRCASRHFSTHIRSICSRISSLQKWISSRIFGLHLRINGLSSDPILLILKRMRFRLYACMNTLY